VAVRHLQEVTTKSINDYLVAKRARDATSPTTILRIREVLHALFEWATKQGYAKSNPASAVPRPKIPDRDIRFLTLDAIDDALDAVKDDPIEGVIATAIYGGLRREEICWLTWEDLSLDTSRPLLRVRSKTIAGESWLPKTRKNRTVPISRDLLPQMKAQQLRGGASAWVFPSPEGYRWDPDNLSHRLKLVMKRARLVWTFLDFRHTFGSQLAQKGVSLFKIAELMGNSPEIARRHYARLVPEQMHEEVLFPRRRDTGSGSRSVLEFR